MTLYPRFEDGQTSLGVPWPTWPLATSQGGGGGVALGLVV